MKKIIIYTFLLANICLFNSCTKELEYGSNFEFKINGLDNTNQIIKSIEKPFSLELLSFFNESKSKNFTFSYACNGVSIISNNVTLLENNDYPFVFNDNNLYNLKLIPLDTGEFTMTVTLTDEFGLSKKSQILIKVIEDLNFTFVANNFQTIYENIITETFTLSTTLMNVGTSNDTYEIKGFSSKSGNININNNLVVQSQYYPVIAGNINVTFKPDMTGTQSLTFVVKNSTGVEKIVVYNLNVNPKIFTLSSLGSLTTKQTQVKDFTFTLNNTIPNWQYQVKFTSNTNANIINISGVNVPLNTYVNLPLNTNTFTFRYLTDAIGSDVLSITVRDQEMQEHSSNTNVTVNSRPTIANHVANIYKGTVNSSGGVGARYQINGAVAYGGSTITEFEFKVLNYATNVFNTYSIANSINIYPSTINDCFHTYYFNSGNCLGNVLVQHTQVTNEDRNINYYWNQPYTIRVKDSDGVWSATINGTMTY